MVRGLALDSLSSFRAKHKKKKQIQMNRTRKIKKINGWIGKTAQSIMFRVRFPRYL